MASIGKYAIDGKGALALAVAFPLLTGALTGCEVLPTNKSLRDTPEPRTIVTDGGMTDVLYEPAKRLANLYCADCHTQGGHNELQPDTWKFALRMDTYDDWVSATKVLLRRLDPAAAAAQDPPEDVMPSVSFPFQPTQAERDTLIEWLKRGSPNTPTGE